MGLGHRNNAYMWVGQITGSNQEARSTTEINPTYASSGLLGHNSNSQTLMKAAAIIGLATANLLVPCSIALGQSSFEIYNHRVASGIDAPVFDAFGVRLEGADYSAELWGGAAADSLTPVLSYNARERVIIPFLTGGEAGYVRHLGDPNRGDPSVFSVPPSGWAWLQLRAWDARLGTTYEEVAAQGIGGYGESSLFYAQGGNPVVILPDPPGRLIGLESFSLRPIVPEPSAWALLALGGTALWLAARGRSQRRL